MKMVCTSKIAINFLDYYLLKLRLKRSIELRLNTSPDHFTFSLSYGLLMSNKSLFKALFRCIKESRLEYDKASGKFTIYDKQRSGKKEFNADIFTVETIAAAIGISDTIQEYDEDFFMVGIDKARFLIRKRVPSDIHVIQENLLEGQYSFIYPFIDASNVMDIGANVGDTAILFCQKGAKTVYAYEPHPFFFDLASKNVKLNGLDDKVVLKPYGVGAKDLVLTLRDDTAFGPTGIFGSKEIKNGEPVNIKIVPFSRAVEEIGSVGVLKMDCEGAEFEAILSCPVSTIRKIRVMAIEFHKDPGPIMEYLKKSDFDVEIKKDSITRSGRTGLLFAVRR